MNRAKVLLADDYKMIADALASLLKESFDLVGLVHDGRSLVQEAVKEVADIWASLCERQKLTSTKPWTPSGPDRLQSSSIGPFD